MQGLPFHAAVVHLPIGLAAVLPLVTAGLALSLWRRWLPKRSWLVAVALQATLVAGAWVAIETGEKEEERAERFAPESRIESHEHRAEGFLRTSAVALGIGAAVLVLPEGPALAAGAAVASLASAVVTASAWRVGHSGGELVYRYGAARTYETRKVRVADSRRASRRRHRD